MTATESVWITGMGATTPLGNDFDSIADGLMAGRSGVGRIDAFNVDAHPSRIAGRVGRVPRPSAFEAGDFSRRVPLEQAVLWCCAEALRDSGWWDRRKSVRVGLAPGLGAEWLVTWEIDSLVSGSEVHGHPHRPEPLLGVAARELELDGPRLTLSAACASGNHAIAQARRWLELGWADVCLAGACDMSVTPISVACFGNLRTLSRRNDTPVSASRPFDRGRDGFVIAEGGAVFVLEPEATARKRGARAFAEVRGFAATSDAYHPVIPSPDPGPAVSAIRLALEDAGLAVGDLDYINAHAPGTPVGDVMEATALRAVLGPYAGRVPVSSTKGMTGHMLAAAGAFECLACLAAFEHQVVPPTINLDDPDPECAGLDHVAHVARPRRVDHVASNSFGFGGSNTCLVLGRV